MGNSLFTMESVNLICGDTGDRAQPGETTHLEIRELKLPALEENYMDHAAGGAPIAIEIDSHVNRLECTFVLAGWNPYVMTMMGRSLRELQHYTAYGVIRDRRTGFALKGMAVLWGRLGRVNPTNFRKGDLHGFEYSIRNITHYELLLATGPTAQGTDGLTAMSEIYYWDFFEPAFRVDGIDIKAEENLILGIPSEIAIQVAG